MNIICTWLGDRIDRSLHAVQLVALMNMVPKIHNDMSLQGIPEDKLNIKSYQTIMNRLKMEESTSMVSGGFGSTNQSQHDGQSNSPGGIFSTSILSSLTSSSGGSSINPGLGQQTPSGQSGASYVGSSPTPSANMSGQANSSGIIPPSPGSFSSRLQYSSQQQQQQFGFANRINESATPTRRFEQLTQQADINQPDADNNLADRAFQSATRMFKGFWAN